MKIISDQVNFRMNFLRPNYLRIYVIITIFIHSCLGLSFDESGSNENPSFSSLADFHSHLARSKAGILGKSRAHFDPLGQRLIEEYQNSAKSRGKRIDGLQGARLLDKLRRARAKSVSKNPGEAQSQKQGSHWRKRQATNAIANTVAVKDTSKFEERQRRWEQDDKFLNSLKPREDCAERLEACAKNIPLRYVECLLDCYVGQAVLGSDKIKYIYRLTTVFTTYSQMLCPVFGNIYQKFLAATGDRNVDATVHGFLTGIGIEYGSADFAMFMKNAADSVFYYLIMYGANIYEDLKSVLRSVGESLRVQSRQALMSPDFLDGQSSACKQLPKATWYLPMIDFITKHPLYTDLLLRGYFLIFRALTQNLPAPTEGMFYALAQAFSRMTGSPCGAIAFAENGFGHDCVPMPPLQEIEEYYIKEAKLSERPDLWITCGAHQVQTQDYINAQKEVQGRSPLEEGQLNGTSVDFPLDKFPNPEELLDDYLMD